MDITINKKELLDDLQAREGSHFIYDEAAILEAYNKAGDNQSSLAIKVLSIIGGYLATSTFLGFFAIAGFFESEIVLIALGSTCIVAAIWLNKKYDKLVIDTFSISLYVIGLALLAFGLFGLKVNENIITILIALIAFIALVITQNFILSFISAITISGSFLVLIFSNDQYEFIHVYVGISTLILTYFFLNEAKIIASSKKLSRLYDPLRMAMVVSLLFGLIAIGKRHLIPISQNHIWISSIVMILVIMYLVYKIIRINEIESRKNKIPIYLLTVLVLLSTVGAPAISGALVIILLCFLVNYKTGLALGIIALIYFVSQFYYDLSFSLLSKSIMLFVSGIMFLLFYLFTTKIRQSHDKL
jgi:uncharacterized membrane protein